MRKMSIEIKVALLFACIMLITCIVIGFGVYSRVTLIVDQEAFSAIDYVYNLMDNTLSGKVLQMESLIKDFSLNTAVRAYMRQPDARVDIEAANAFSEYVDAIKATRPDIFSLKVYDQNGVKIKHSGGYPALAYYGGEISPEAPEALEMVKPGGESQHWVRESADVTSSKQDVVSVYANIYDLTRLERLGTLEVEFLADSLFAYSSQDPNDGLLVYMMVDNQILWGAQEGRNDALVDKMMEMPTGTQTLRTKDGAYFAYRQNARSGIGAFCLAKPTEEMKRSNREFILYMVAVLFAVVSVNIIVALRVSRKMLNPLVRFQRMVNEIDPEISLEAAPDEMTKLMSLQNEVGGLARSFDSMVKKVHVSMESAEQANVSRRKLELELLMSQIKPHFLYNTIEVICSMARLGKNKELYSLAKSLGVFYRLSLSKGALVLNVEQELTHVEHYINIERIRRNEAFDYTIHIQPETKKLRILKILLQPIVENALQHGIRRMETGGVISVSATLRAGNILLLEVMDNGVGIPPDILAKLNEGGYVSKEKDGFGLQNVQERIRHYYGPSYGLHFISENGAGTCVQIALPAEIEPLMGGDAVPRYQKSQNNYLYT